MNFCIVGVMNLGCTKKSHYPQFYLKEEKMMKKSIKTILSNQLSRKYKFIASPILKRAKSKYQKKVNQYAQLYHSTSIKPHQILYQVRDGKSITDSP